MKIARLLFAALLLAPLALSGADEKPKPKPKPKRAPNPAYAQIEDVAGLPRVLLLGDSISIGYTVPTREALKGVANVHRPPTNCGPTTTGLAQIEQWLGDGKWDVIHFNWGLHDLKYMGPDGKNLADPADPKNHQQVPPADYEKNLQQLLVKLKATGAKLIWCSTTPVPEGASGRAPGDAEKYNAIAAKVMKEHGVAIDDLYAFAKPRMEEIGLAANVHFSKEGSETLAGEVAKSIRAALEQRN